MSNEKELNGGKVTAKFKTYKSFGKITHVSIIKFPTRVLIEPLILHVFFHSFA